MKIKKLKQEYLEPLRKLRNSNREWFFNKDFVTPEKQQEWYESISRTKKIRFYIIEIENQVVGSLSLTKTREGVEIGNILLDDTFRGQGIMTKVIQKLIKNKKNKFYARILLENLNSQNLFKRCGFVKTAYVMELKC